LLTLANRGRVQLQEFIQVN